jgi:hypothetical protein
MGKFRSIQDDIFSIFSKEDWKSEEIKTIPSNLESPEGEFVRVNILTDGKGVNSLSLSGILIVDIFSTAGTGPTRTVDIADILDKYLHGKTLGTAEKGVVQLFSSSHSFIGIEETYARSQYSIPFKYYRGQ